MAIDRKIRFGEFLVHYDDAVREVRINRTVGDILKATPGDDMNCMNSQCIKAQRNQHAFPHPVYAVSTIKSRIYVIDKLDDSGNFAHAVRYELTEKASRLIQEHDSYAAGEPGELILRIPKDPKGSPKRRAAKNGGGFADGAGHGKNPGKPSTGERSHPIHDSAGATARYKVSVGAGLVKTEKTQ